MNDYESHLGSYDHSHRQRMKDMKQMVKDPTAGARARKAEAKADGLISIKLGESNTSSPGGGGGGGGGFKKGGFKKSGFKSAFTPIGGAPEEEDSKPKEAGGDNISNTKEEKAIPRDLNAESDTEDEGYEVYNPRFPTD